MWSWIFNCKNIFPLYPPNSLPYTSPFPEEVRFFPSLYQTINIFSCGSWKAYYPNPEYFIENKMIFIFRCILPSTQLHPHNKSIALSWHSYCKGFSSAVPRAQLIYLPEAQSPKIRSLWVYRGHFSLSK